MASLQDSAFTLVFIFSFALIMVLGVLLFNFLAPVLNTAFVGSPVSQNVVSEWTSWFPGFMSWVFGILFVSIPLIGAGLALLVGVNNFWWWVYAALSVLLLGIGWAFQSLWGWFTAVEIVGDAASAIPVLSLIMNNFALYSVLVILFIGLLTYVKSRQRPAIPGGFV